MRSHVAKSKMLNAGLIVTSLMGYLEWGKSNSMFLFMAEWEVLTKLFTDPVSVLHPFTVLPMAGQLVLLITLFQSDPGKRLTFIGLGGLSVFLLFMFLIGLMGLNYKIALSVLPFIILGVFTVRHHRRS